MLTKIIQLVDKNPDIFKDWACPCNCWAAVCSCRNTNPVTRYVCYKIIESSLSN